MTLSKSIKLSALLGVSSILLLSYTNCAGPTSSSADFADSASQRVDGNRLEISPQAPTINWQSELMFEAAGGIPPYRYTIVTGGGTLNPHTGRYTAPNYDTTVIIQVQDENNDLAQSSALVRFGASAELKLTYSPTKITVGDKATLTASGGKAPYTYKVVSGVGSIDTNIYTASAIGTVVIGIQDANGKQNTVTLAISSSMSAESVQVYKWYSTKHKKNYFTVTKKATEGWVSKGAAFKVLKGNVLSSVPIIRCFIKQAGSHYLSTSGTCASNTNEAVLGYVYTYEAKNSLELLSCFNSKTNDYLATTSAYDCSNNGYAKQGRFGYVPK